MSETWYSNDSTLQNAVTEIERHVGTSGWDQPPQIFALVDTGELLRAQPELATAVGMAVDEVPDGALTPVQQDPLPDTPLDETLSHIAWSDEVRGCALVHEVVVLPPGAQESLPEDTDVADYAASHPDRREARLAVGVLRDGSRASVVRLRGAAEEEDSVLSTPDLAPNLADALLSTLR